MLENELDGIDMDDSAHVRICALSLLLERCEQENAIIHFDAAMLS